MADRPALLRKSAPFSPEPACGWLPWGALAPLLGILFLLLPALATLAPMEALGLTDARGDPIGTDGLILFLLIPFALTGLLVLGWVTWVERRPLATIGLTRPFGTKTFLAGLAVGAATIFAVVVASWIAGALVPAGYAPALASPVALGTIALLLLAFAVQSSVEELVFRGWLLSVTARKFNPLVAVALVTLVFALLHFSRGQPWLVTFNLVLFSVFTCCWALRTGNIWGVMGWHAGWNWLLATGFELPVTGLDAGVPALLVRLNAAGPDYLTGGAQGPEGSVFCTLFFLIGIAAAARARTRA
jgi:membrane protease YdiL (CAAX protease family)